MKWLLDTNVVSEGVRRRPNLTVVDWIAAQPRRDLAISEMTLAELRDGADRNVARRTAISEWIDSEVLGLFGDQTIPVSVEILIDWIRLLRRLRTTGKPKDAGDLLIAATAHIHDLIVVTRNLRDFANTGIIVYDPWNDQTHRMDAP